MYQLKNPEDTIAAISTAMGQGGIGIVRLSGKEAVAIADKIFLAANKKELKNTESHMVHYGWVYSGEDREEVLDEVLVTVMRAPRSYTREDVVEISCHGGAAVVRAVLVLSCELGARLAEPGEFTRRAFLSGRIDLTQAEAVLDIIHSKTESFLQVSTHQLKGELSAELECIREQLMEIYVAIEAIVNFPEDDTEVNKEQKELPGLIVAGRRIEELLSTSEHGKILKDGVKIVLCGKPNVGKSSLLNVLLKTPRAIVSNIAGTTRDTIEEMAQIKGVPFQLVDTAGILEPRDILEKEAVKRSHVSMQGADLILLVFDASISLSEEDRGVIKQIKGKNILGVLNKCDLHNAIDREEVELWMGGAPLLEVSVLEKKGLKELEEAIVENVWKEKHINRHGVFISNLRHIHALKDAQKSLHKAQKSLREGLSLEFVSEEIKTSVNFLDNITGRNIDSDLLDDIFSKFCIGK